MVVPVDFPVEALDPLLIDLAKTHQSMRPTPIQQTVTDEGLDVCLLAYTIGPMYLQLFFRIRTEGGDLGVPLEADLEGPNDTRIPLYRAEYPFWPEPEGVASLLAPLPEVKAPLKLRVRQVRLFTLGAGSRALKVRALSPRPRQAPPVQLNPGAEERYRATISGPAPVELHKDVFGYWDFDVPAISPPTVPGRSCHATLNVPGGTVTIDGLGARHLSGHVSLDWTSAYAQPPEWEGLSTVHTEDGNAGVGSFRTDGRIVWLFADPLPETVMLRRLNLYRIPAAPPLAGSCQSSLHPFLRNVPCTLRPELSLGRLPLRIGNQPALATVLQGQVETRVEGVQGDVRPTLRFWSRDDKTDQCEIEASWQTAPGEVIALLPPEFPPPTHWDAPWVDLLLPQTALLLADRGPDLSLSPPFVSPTFYSTRPFRMA